MYFIQSYLFYIEQYVYDNSNLQIYPSHPFSPSNRVFYICDYFCFMNNVICTIFFKIPHISDIIHVFLCLTSLSMTFPRPIPVAANGIICSFKQLNSIPLYIYVAHHLYPFHCQWIFRLLPYSGYVNSATMNMGCTLHGFLSCLVSFFLFYICSPCNGFHLPQENLRNN